jgi:hypothetical protein
MYGIFLSRGVLNFGKWILNNSLWLIYLLEWFLGFANMFIRIGKLTSQCWANCRRLSIDYFVKDVIKTFKKLAC